MIERLFMVHTTDESLCTEDPDEADDKAERYQKVYENVLDKFNGTPNTSAQYEGGVRKSQV